MEEEGYKNEKVEKKNRNVAWSRIVDHLILFFVRTILKGQWEIYPEIIIMITSIFSQMTLIAYETNEEDKKGTLMNNESIITVGQVWSGFEFPTKPDRPVATGAF